MAASIDTGTYPADLAESALEQAEEVVPDLPPLDLAGAAEPSLEAEPMEAIPMPAPEEIVPAEEPALEAVEEAPEAPEEAPEAAAGPGQSLEDCIKEMLRPMLREWLDDNMERIVKDEVASGSYRDDG